MPSHRSRAARYGQAKARHCRGRPDSTAAQARALVMRAGARGGSWLKLIRRRRRRAHGSWAAPARAGARDAAPSRLWPVGGPRPPHPRSGQRLPKADGGRPGRVQPPSRSMRLARRPPRVPPAPPSRVRALGRACRSSARTGGGGGRGARRRRVSGLASARAKGRTTDTFRSGRPCRPPLRGGRPVSPGSPYQGRRPRRAVVPGGTRTIRPRLFDRSADRPLPPAPSLPFCLPAAERVAAWGACRVPAATRGHRGHQRRRHRTCCGRHSPTPRHSPPAVSSALPSRSGRRAGSAQNSRPRACP